MKTKLSNFRMSEEFNHFIESIWRLKKYRSKGIMSKSDLWRYGLLRTLESENKGLLKQFKGIPEIDEFLNPPKDEGVEIMKDKVKEYFKNRGGQP